MQMQHLRRHSTCLLQTMTGQAGVPIADIRNEILIRCELCEQ